MSKLTFATMSARYLIGCLLLAISVIARADPPKTREEVVEIFRRCETDSHALLELKGAPLDLIIPYSKRVVVSRSRSDRKIGGIPAGR